MAMQPITLTSGMRANLVSLQNTTARERPGLP